VLKDVSQALHVRRVVRVNSPVSSTFCFVIAVISMTLLVAASVLSLPVALELVSIFVELGNFHCCLKMMANCT